jgi:hypothetical protein
MQTRRLVLAKETLSDLHAEELRGIVGAAALTSPLAMCVETAASLVVHCVSLVYYCA